MINIDYSNHEIRVTTEKVSSILETPLTLKIISQVSHRDVWTSQLNDGWWASFPTNEINDVEIFDKNGKFVVNKKWDVMNDGNYLYKSLYLYCNNMISSGRRPKGIAIGTHDGEFGEWVPCVLSKKTDAILVEASEPQFKLLEKYYSQLDNVELVNSLITNDGKPVEFFEGGRGYTNSIVERVIRGWEKEEINSTLKESLSINELIKEKIDWIHTDVEGYDAKLIMGIDPEKLPNFIIFEYENLKIEEGEELKNYLTNLGFVLEYKKVSCLAIRK